MDRTVEISATNMHPNTSNASSTPKLWYPNKEAKNATYETWFSGLLVS